jgi:hypothetical protein
VASYRARRADRRRALHDHQVVVGLDERQELCAGFAARVDEVVEELVEIDRGQSPCGSAP